MKIEFRAWDTAIHKDGVMIAWEQLKKHYCEDVFLPLLEVELMQYTGYKMFDEKVFFGDLVSNNYKTDKAVIREVVLKDGAMKLKRVKGNSSLPKYILLHEFYGLNFKIIGNKFENPELLIKG